MIKIAFVIDTIESPTAGTEKQLLLLIKHLDRSRFQPYLCVLRTSPWLENEFDLCSLFIAGVNSFKSLKGLKGISDLSKFLKKEKVNIVQAHFRDSSIAGILAAKLAGIRTIIGTRRNQGYQTTHLDRKIQKFFDRWVTTYICNSESTKRWMEDNEGVDYRRINVINNGFELSSFEIREQSINKKRRELLAIPEHAPVIVIVANLRPVKDHSTFLKAAQIVHQERPDSYFLVVGSGDGLANLQALSTELGIAHAVKFLGERHDIPEIVTMCDVGVLSSYSESFSNAIVEYMAAGLPVVTTEVGGAREAVDNGVNGFIVPVGDIQQMANRILEVIQSGRTFAMGQESRRRSEERFSLATMIQNSEQLYLDYCSNVEELSIVSL